MDINAKINWKSGMSLTSEVLSAIEEGLATRRSAMLRAGIAGAWGILPASQFSCRAMFVNGTVEVKMEDCVALLPSGKLLHVNDEAGVPVGHLEDGIWYFCVGFGEGSEPFEKKGVPYLRPKYAYRICQAEEISDELPLLRLVVGGGNISMDKDFIIPGLLLSSDGRYAGWLEKMAAILDAIAVHPHQEEGEARRSFLHLKFLAGGYDCNDSVREYMRFIHEAVMAVGYYIRPDAEMPGSYRVCDPQLYLKACYDYFTAAVTKLDDTVPEDHSIDVEALRKEIHDEVYAQVREELGSQIEARMTQLSEELRSGLEESLRGFMEKEFRPALEKQLSEELSEKLQKNLHDRLYQELYQALFVPEKEEEIYTPII